MPLYSDKGTPVKVDPLTGGLYTTEKPRRFYFHTELEDDVWSDAILIPRFDIHSISYDLDTEGTANVQCTISPPEAIQAGTAIWRDLPDNVRINPSIIAIRGRATGATGTFTVVAL